ncbi:sigma factor-like helix-turn-helix DNA-binding protein [Cryobacterium sp. CG_9.6]|uniref:sigma factor-like helix-turn-helix DNA-binding protein n=1 Tax=Cryobacterium sp. CG_9.6 TaxID=2760710 RepID=UPI002475CFCB|nr:sigma factor-like helix-turn-helix DNA-binding protein [Cryobacterium sp. CG_9.6]MDH6236116.1 hypothetical protein [Cryobacterium sp. CG_9.6]
MPARQIRPALHPSRIILAVLAVGLVVVGTVAPDLGGLIESDLGGLIVLLLGAVMLLAAVAFPVIKDVEFGFPMGVKFSTAMRDRDGELRVAFTEQRGDLGLYTQMMSDDPDLTARLLEAAWARTAAVWRGPVTPELRPYVLCEFVRLLKAQSQWNQTIKTGADLGEARTVSSTPLSELSLDARIVVVLREFAGLPTAQIAFLTNRPLAEVAADLRRAQARLRRFDASRDDS